MLFKKYLAEAQKQYNLRIKTVAPLDDDAMDRIEMAVAKYLPLSISKVKKTIIQRQPMEFPDIQNAEVYIVDISFGMPAAPHIIRDDIRKALQVSDSQVFVRNQASPGELEIETLCAIADIEAEALEKGYRPAALLNDPWYNEAESSDHAAMFGNAYNAAFLSHLHDVQKEKAERASKIANAPLAWLNLPDREVDKTNFNDHVKGAPKVSPEGISTPEVSQNILGHFAIGPDNEIRRAFLDQNGNRVILTRKLGDTL